MCLNLSGLKAWSIFGIRVRKVALREGRTVRDLWEASSKIQTSSLIRCQQKWKKYAVKPLGPGALPWGVSLRVESTSSWLMGLMSVACWSSVISLGMSRLIDGWWLQFYPYPVHGGALEKNSLECFQWDHAHCGCGLYILDLSNIILLSSLKEGVMKILFFPFL